MPLYLTSEFFFLNLLYLTDLISWIVFFHSHFLVPNTLFLDGGYSMNTLDVAIDNKELMTNI